MEGGAFVIKGMPRRDISRASCMRVLHHVHGQTQQLAQITQVAALT